MGLEGLLGPCGPVRRCHSLRRLVSRLGNLFVGTSYVAHASSLAGRTSTAVPKQYRRPVMNRGWLASTEPIDLRSLVAETPGAALLNAELCNLLGGLLQKDSRVPDSESQLPSACCFKRSVRAEVKQIDRHNPAKLCMYDQSRASTISRHSFLAGRTSPYRSRSRTAGHRQPACEGTRSSDNDLGVARCRC